MTMQPTSFLHNNFSFRGYGFNCMKTTVKYDSLPKVLVSFCSLSIIVKTGRKIFQKKAIGYSLVNKASYRFMNPRIGLPFVENHKMSIDHMYAIDFWIWACYCISDTILRFCAD